MDYMNHRIYIHITLGEKELIIQRMQQAGMRNLSAYVRKMALNGYIIQLDMSDVKEILRLLKINSNNLNQYVKKANETGNIYYEDIMELKKSQGEILQKMGCVLDRLSGIME